MSTKDRKRASLQNKLKNLFDSDPEVSFNMNVQNGLFRLAANKDEITGYLNNQPIKSFKIAELDEEIREALEDNPEEAGIMILNEIIAAHEDGKLGKEAKYKGESIGWDDQHENITQKQLEKGDVLHDRKDKEWDTITENQLDSSSENYTHPTRWNDEYKSLTEKQLEDKKNLHADTSPREDDERDSITQKQIDGDTDYPAGGRRDYEADTVTEDQLKKDFRNDELHSLTEKQLAGGEQNADETLIRRLASKEDAITFAKKVAQSAAKSIKKHEIEIDDALKALKQSMKGYKSQKRIASFLEKKAQHMDMDAPMVMDDDEVNPEGLAQDVLGDDGLSGGYDVDLMIEVMPRLFEKPEIRGLIEEAMAEAESAGDEMGMDDEVNDLDMLDMALEDGGMEEEAMMHHAENEEAKTVEASEMCEDCECDPCDCGEKEASSDDDENIEKEADAEENSDDNIEKEADSDDDGLIAVEGDIADLGLEEGYSEQQLVEAGYKNTYKTAQNSTDAEIVEFRFDVNVEDGKFRAVFAKSEVAKEGLDKRASNRADKLNKVAQMPPAGGGMPEMGGEMGGGGTTMPPGPADPALGTPPVESFTETGDDEMGGADEDFEITPPGTKCPVCGSDDVDVENGHFDCHGCEAQGEMSIEMNVTRWPGSLEDSKGEGEELGEEPMEEEMGMDLGMPMAASVTTLGRKFYKQASKSGKMVFMAGKHCPTCGSDNTEVEIDGLSQCFNCSQKYATKVASTKDDIKLITVWRPITEAKECEDCDVEKIASKEEKMQKIANANYQFNAPLNANQFNDCLSKMSHRFGLNAIAMSGACKGKPLAQCTCNKMYSADKNSDALIMRLANRLIEKDPMDECVEDKIREGLDKESACDTCEELKKKAFFEFPEEEEIELIVDTPMSDMEGDDIMVDDHDGILEEVADLLHRIEDIIGNDDADDIIDDSESLLEDDSYDGDDDMEGLDNDGDGDHDMEDHEIEEDDDMGDGDMEDEAMADKSMKHDNMEHSMDDGMAMSGNDPMQVMKDSMENMQNAMESMMEKEGMEGMDDNEESCMASAEESKTVEANTAEEEVAEESTEEKEGENPEVSNEEEEQLKLAQQMKASTVKRYNETDSLTTLTTADTMQLNDLVGDRKISDQAKEVTPDRKTSQEESGEIGTIQDGSTMGHEESFDASEPEVPMGKNESLMGPDEEIPTDKVSIPAGDGAMGHEKETVGDDVMTDHDGRVQQTTASNEKQTKVASEVTIKDPKALEDSADLKGQKLQDGSTMGHEEKFDAKDPDVPMDNQVLGPDESKDMDEPKVPAGGGAMGHEGEIVDTAVDTEIKGTTIANAEKDEVLAAKVQAERIKLATKLASLEMMDGEITPKEYNKEVEVLSMSSVPTLKTLLERYEARRDVKASSKSNEVKTASAPTALETPLLSGLSGETKEDSLKDQLTSMFSITKKLDEVQK